MLLGYVNKLLGALVLLFVIVHAVAASSWKPTHSIEIVAGTNPGGAADLTARTIQRIIQEQKLIDMPMAVVNKAGAGGAVGWAFINQRADGGNYLSIATPPLLTNHITGKSKLNYTDLTPVVLLFGEYFVFVVRADSPIKTGKDLVQRMRDNPSMITVGVASSGGANHIAVGLVAKKAGVDVRKLKIVVFNSGGDTLTALLGGHIDLVAANPSSARQLIETAKARAIAVAAPTRLQGSYAEVPTWREQGVDAALMTWRGIVGPRDMQKDQIAYWEQVFRRLVQTESWKEDLKKNDWKDAYLDSAGTKKFLDEEYGVLKSVLSDLGMAN